MLVPWVLRLMSLVHRFLSTTCMTVAVAAAFGVGIGGRDAMANPQDGVVVGGAASIVANGKKLDITQTTDRAVIDWNKFDIAPDEHTQFYQPNSSSIILNRINSTTSSTIAGKLSANGNVILVNPNGILFSKTAIVDVNGLVATTADIDNNDFMEGSLNFNKTGNPNATIENQGLISAKDSGLVGLVAPNVMNSGIINAKLGRAQLSSGDSVTIDFYGDGLLEVKASDALTAQTVTNTGIINAAGGTIAITAAAVRYTVNSVVKVSGELHAPTVGVRHGKIIIGAAGSNAVAGNKSADKGQKTGVSTVLVDAVLDVRGDDPGETGGTITITADHIGILDGAKIDASGYDGGGTIHIGGDYLGQGETPTALVTIIQSAVDIKANALGNGNGGEVIIYADDRTEFSGNIEAMGAGDDGNGGFTETSGKNNLLAMGTVRLNAGRRGKAGTWLMDPADITITTATDTNNTGNPNFTATAASSQVSATSIKANLDAGTNVTIVTSNDAYAGNGDIIVSSAITTTGSGSLTLSAYRNITVLSTITLTGGSLTLRADNSGIGSGSILTGTGANLTTNGGNITMGGGSGAITAGSGFAVGNSDQITGISIGAAINAGSGNIIINGKGFNSTTNGNHGVVTNAAITTTGSGTITINGIGQGTAGSGTNYGVLFNGSTALSTVNGALTINGTSASSSGSDNIGLYAGGNPTIQTTGSGTLTLSGISLSTGGNGKGMYFNSGGTFGATGTGDIIVTGVGSAAGTGHYNIGIQLDWTIANSGTGKLTVTGTGGGTGGAGYNYGMLLQGGSFRTASGLLTVSGFGGNLSGTGGTNDGINSTTSNTIRTTTTGSIIINAVKGGTSGAGVSTGNTNAINTAGAGNITVYTDTISLSGTNAINAAGVLTIAPYTNIGMSVGTNVASTFNLDNTSLNNTNGASYVLGALITGNGTTSTSDLTINTTKNFVDKNVTFISGRDINLTGTLTKATGAGTATYLFQAYRNIYNSSSAGLSATTGLINLTLQSDYDGNDDGAISLTGGTINTNGGNVTIGGGTGTIAAASGYGAGNATYVNGVRIASTITAAGGNIIINGKGAVLTTSANTGVILASTGSITTTGAGSITINGTGRGSGGSSSYNYGTNIGGLVSVVNGALTITANSIATAVSNHGFVMSGAAARLLSTGSGDIIISGTVTGAADMGLYIDNAANAIISSGTGNISVTGYGGVSGSYNDGIRLTNTSSIKNTGAGNITLNGTTGSVNGNSNGIVMAVTSTISTTTGNINITAVGGLGGGSNQGLSVGGGSIISSVDGTITVANATGAAGGGATGGNTGLALGGTGSAIQTTGNGNIVITAASGNNGNAINNNHGIVINGTVGIQALGNGSITLTGTGGGITTSSNNNGVYVAAGSIKTAGTGSINITGIGGNASGTGGTNYGIYSAVANGIQTTGSGSIVLRGVKGAATSSFGVFSGVGNAYTTTGTGNITVFTDTISLTAANVINSAGVLTIAPYSNIGMSVGTNVASTFNVSATNLPNMNGASYVFGALVTGNGTTSTSDLTINTTNDFGTKNVTYISGNDINLAGTLTKATGAGTATYLFQANRSIYNSSSAGIATTTGLINLTLQSDYDANNDGAISFTGGTINSNGGNITIGGGSGAITAGSGYAVGNATYTRGVSLASTITAAGGNIIVNGKGYLGTTSNNMGIYINGVTVSTTGLGAISLNGIGQGSGAFSTGINLNGGVVSTVNGNISAIGTSVATGSGTSNMGVYLSLATSSITATGSGAITVTGTGAAATSGSFQHGVALQGTIIGNGAIINVSGTAGGNLGNSSDNRGIELTNTATGTIRNSGIINVTGVGGGAGTGFQNYGVWSGHTAGSSILVTGAGALTVMGTGGNLSGSGGSNHGIIASSANAFRSTGSGDVILKGVKGGQATSVGIYSVASNGIATTGTGNLTLYTDTIGATVSNAMNTAGILTVAPYTNIGLSLGTNVASTSNISNAILANMTGASYVFGALTVGNGVTSTGDVTINTTNDFGTKNVTFLSANDINLAGTLTKATGAGTATYLFQAYRNIYNSNSAGVTATTGLINLTLQSDYDADSSGAVSLASGTINTNGGNITMGGGTGAITAAAGYAYGNSTYGAGVALNTMTIQAGGGNIIINGVGKNAGAGYGISINGGTLATTGTGTITLNGMGRNGSGTSHGIQIVTFANVSTVDGALLITGTGNTTGGAGQNNYGVYMGGGTARTTGTGTLTVVGTSSTSTGGTNHGISLEFGGVLSTVNGALSVTGTSISASGDANSGININGSSSAIRTTGSGSLTVTGQGGVGSGNSNTGIALNAGSTISTLNGMLNVNGTGGGGGTGANNYGVYVGTTNSTIKTTGTGALTIDGTGGTGSGGHNYGVFSGISAYGIQTTGAGSITVYATGGAGGNNFGVRADTTNGIVTTGTGNISIYTDLFNLSGANNINSIGVLTIAPRTTGTMVVGTTGGTLALSDTYLGYINGASYVFGATAAGNMMINTTKDFGDKNVTFISGGNINLAGTLTKASGAGTASYLFQANGDITNSNSAGVSATSGLITLTMTSDKDISGAGNIVLTSAPLTVNGGTITLNSNGQSVTQSGIIGGNETINSANGAVSIGLLDGNTAGTRNLTVNGGTGTFTTTAAVGSTAKLGSVAVTADNVALGANFAGSGTLTLQPITTSRVQNVVAGTDDGTNFNLSAAEVGYLVDGWTQINIGNSASTADMSIGTTSWVDPVTFRSSYRKTVGALTGTGNASFTFTGSSGWVDLYGNIVTAGGVVNMGSAGYLYMGATGKSIVTNGGNVTLPSVKLNDYGLSVGTSTGNLTFAGDVTGNNNLTANAYYIYTTAAWGAGGAALALGNVSLTSVGSVSLPSITTTTGKSITVNITGTGGGNSITTSGALTAGTGGNITLYAEDLILGGNLVGTGALTLRPNSLTRVVRVNNGSGDFNLSGTEIGYFVDGWSSITIGHASSTADMNIGTSTWLDPITFRSNSRVTTAAGSVISTTDATAPITFSVGWLDAYGTITSANAATFNTSNASGYVSYGSTVNTTNNNISFSGNVRAYSGALILDAGTGTIALPNGVNTIPSLGLYYDLTATAGAFTIGSGIGTAGGIGNVTLTSTNSISLPTINTAAGKTVNVTVTGAGNSITTTGAISTGAAGNITLTSDDLILGGNLSGTGIITLQPYATNRTVNINYGTADGTNFNLSTAEIAYLVDGWAGIKIGRTNATGPYPNGYSFIGASTWYDPVTFYAYDNLILGTVAGQGNASITLSGSASNEMQASGGITTQGQNITANGLAFYAANTSINSNGGNISLSTIRGNVANIGVTSVSSGGGNISISAISPGSVTSGTYNLNAGSGTISLLGTVNTATNISANAASMTLGGAWGSTTPLGNVTLTSVNGIALPSIKASSILVQTTGVSSDVTIGSGNSLTASGAGDAIRLVSGRNFVNNSGSATPLVLTGTGRSLVYSASPTDDTLNGMTSGFVRYGCTYGGSCPTGTSIPATGNGSIYVYQPTLTVTPTAINTIYGNAVPSLVGYGYSASGYLTGAAGADSGTNIFTGTLTGTTSYVQGDDVGTYNLDYSSGTLTSSLGYAIVYANNASGISVGQRTLVTTLAGLVSKTYDGDDIATLVSGNFSLGNVYGADALTITNTSGNYDNKNAGTGKNVTVTGLTLSGTKSSNYVLGSSSVTGAIGTIGQKGLTLVGLSAGDKTYDGGAVASLSGTAALDGLIASDVVDIDGAGVATFVDKNVGTAKAVTISGFSIIGADADNYNLSQPTGLTANVSARTVTLVGLSAEDKVYDGNVSATLNGTATFSGIIGADDVVLDGTGLGAFLNKNVEAGKAVTISGYSISGSDAVNYIFSQPTGITATITPKALTVSGLSAVNKVYDGSAAAALTGTASFSGIIGSDDVNLSGTVVGSYSDKNAGTGKAVTISGYSISGVDATNYIFSQPTGITATITPKDLTVTGLNAVNKIYDGSAVAALTGTASFSGIIGSDVVNLAGTAVGAYSDKDVGTGKSVTVSGFTINGTDANNYVFSQPTGITGNITQKALVVTVADRTVIYGATTPSSSLSYSGFISGEGEGLLATAPTLLSAASGIQDAGVYTGNYTASGGVDTNYSFSYVSGNLTVTPRALTVVTDDIDNSAGATGIVFTGSNNLLASDAALINWVYAPIGYSGAAGIYTIGATANDPSSRLSNYVRTNDYGVYNIGVAPLPPTPTIPEISPQLISTLFSDVVIPTFIILEVPVYNSQGEVVSTKKEWVDTSNLSNTNQPGNSNLFMLSYSDELKKLLAVQ